jgi:arginase
MHVIQRRYAVIEAPSVLGLRPTGVDQLSSTLIRNGLMARLAARHAARVEGLPYSAERDRDTRTLNPHGIAQWSPRLADAVEQAVERGDCPVILGGDCSILLGAMLAFRRRGRFGLLFIDGHADFYQPEVNPNGEAASMELAFAVGYGPSVLTDFEGRRPLVRSSDVVAFGFAIGTNSSGMGVSRSRQTCWPSNWTAYETSASPARRPHRSSASCARTSKAL